MNAIQDVDNFAVYSSAHVAEHYASLDYLTPCEQLLFDKYIVPGMAVLDAGVGGGRTTTRLARNAGRYVGIDYSDAMVSNCRKRFPELNFQTADASDLSAFADNSFNAIVMAFNSVDYIVPETRRWQCFKECRRVLQPRGILIFSSHNPRSVLTRPGWNPRRLREFAGQFISESSFAFPLVVFLLTALRASHAILRAIGTSLARIIRRAPTAAFWRGEGHLIDSAHGGLLTHYWTPQRAVAELSSFNFRLAEILGDDFPRKSRPLVTDWYYYVFVKACEDACD